MFGIEVFGWTPIFHAETKTFRLEGSVYAHLDKEVVDRPMGVRFTKSAIDGLGYLTNAPQDADLTQIPRITTNPFGGLALQYPSGVGEMLLSATQAEQIVEAKEIALEDRYDYGPYWIDEITTFGCADPTATNYESDIDFHAGDWYCGYGCADEYRKTNHLGNCLADCEDGYELVQASQAKPAECVAIEELKNGSKGGTDECESGYELDNEGNCIESSDESIDETIEESPNYLLFGGIAVAGLMAFVVMKK
jgi:hypothetical protein